MGEVTNGTIDSAHYGPIGDGARNIASYCDGNARVHVYTAAFNALTTAQAEIEALRAEIEAQAETSKRALAAAEKAMREANERAEEAEALREALGEISRYTGDDAGHLACIALRALSGSQT